MITRRAFAIAPMGLAACATVPEGQAQVFLRRAINAAGGEAALRRARVLAWTGRAVVHAGGRDIEIGVDTVVEPFVYARSETWLLSQGRSSARILEIEGEQGWLTRDGQRTPLPQRQLEHERQQYALYGLMRLVTLLDAGARIEDTTPIVVSGTRLLRDEGFESASVMRTLAIEHPLASGTELGFDEHDRLVVASNEVVAPDGNGSLHQAIRFGNRIESGGVRWPGHMRISQRTTGAEFIPFFELWLDAFTPRQRR